jgi:hypothetical protein
MERSCERGYEYLSLLTVSNLLCSSVRVKEFQGILCAKHKIRIMFSIWFLYSAQQSSFLLANLTYSTFWFLS